MRRLVVLVGVVALAATLPALAGEPDPEESLSVKIGTPKVFAKKLTPRPGPILPVPPPKVEVPVPEDPDRRPTRLMEPITSIEGAVAESAGSINPHEMLESGAVLSLPRGGGAASSPVQEGRRSLKKLIRQLG